MTGDRAFLGRIPAWVTAALLAAIYLVAEPQTGDHAAQIYRSGLFEREGFSLWDDNWYAGHHIPGYSALFGPLAAVLGPRVLAALAAVLATALFQRLSDNWAASQFFALGISTQLLTGRLTFLLGVAVGVGALLALKNHRPLLTCGLATATALASPVAGLFLALCACAVLIDDRRRLDALATAVLALAPTLLLSVAFPEGGDFPFPVSAWLPQVVGTTILVLLARKEQRTLRIGLVLYALLLLLTAAVETPIGGNTARLGQLAAGSVAAIALLPDRRQLLLVITPLLLFWQWSAPVQNYVRTLGDESVHAGYYRELNDWLDRQPGPLRIEIPFTENHWEAAYVAPAHALARGWERQLDRKYNRLFYEGRLTKDKYLRWLQSNAISLVALPDAPLDFSAKQEARLIAAGIDGLEPIGRLDHWRLYRVREPVALATGATVSRVGHDVVELTAPRPGTIRLRIRWTPYWRISQGSGCVSRDGDWTKLELKRAGPIRLTTSFSPGRIGSTQPRCTAG